MQKKVNHERNRSDWLTWLEHGANNSKLVGLVPLQAIHLRAGSILVDPFQLGIFCVNWKNCRCWGSTEDLLKCPRFHTAWLTDGLRDHGPSTPSGASLVILTHLWAPLCPDWHLDLGCESTAGSKGLWWAASTRCHWSYLVLQLTVCCEQLDVQWWLLCEALGAAMTIKDQF